MLTLANGDVVTQEAYESGMADGTICRTCVRPAKAGYRSPGGREQCADACHDAYKQGADLTRAIKCRKAIRKMVAARK